MQAFHSTLARKIEIGPAADPAASRRHIAIIGGGASGTLMALALTRHRADISVCLIEPSRVGSGLAYGASHAEHRLNVLPRRLSAFPDGPDDFASWLVARGEIGAIEEKVFVRRALVGEYLRERLAKAGPQITIHPFTATSIVPAPGNVRISLATGEVIDADAAILATGHSWAAARDQDRLAQPGEPVTILGTGLGMVDRWLSLRANGHRGRITALSRHGLRPLSHGGCPTPLSLPAAPMGRPVSQTMRWLRDLAAQVPDWRVAVDALRPHTQAIWQAWTLEERRRFVRHARRHWDIHRHRIAPDIAERLAEEIGSGTLRILRAATCDADTVTYDCRGHLPDWSQIRNPLIARLLAGGVIRPDPLGLGLDVTTDCRLIRADGKPWPHLHAIGPVTRGQFWEIEAIPDIRAQCERLARSMEGRAADARP